MHCLIPANTLLPKTVIQELYPQQLAQRQADICVYQGDFKCTNQNAYLGFVRLLGLQPGHPQLFLKVTVTTNGMVELDVRDEENNQVIGSLSL
jgi:molecular chaperone DnaK (HSP70)